MAKIVVYDTGFQEVICSFGGPALILGFCNMLQNLLLSLICLLILSCKTPASAQENNNWAGQSALQQGGQNTQNNSWQAPAQGWQPLGATGNGGGNASDMQAGPSFYGNATTTQPNDQYQEPGAYLNQPAPNNAFNDTVSANSTAASGQQNNSGATNSNGNPQQQGKVKKNHEGLKSALNGVGRAFETAAVVAAPVAEGYMIGRALQSGYGYGSPYGMRYPGYGMGGYGMSPYGYGGYPMGMGGYGMPMMNPGMSSFLHY